MIQLIKKMDKVLLISIIIAIISCFFVPIDSEYVNYFDFKTLTILFLMMLVIGGFRNIKIFDIIADRLVRKLKNTRSVIIFLVLATVLGDMILANDMSLITFIPLTFAIFKGSKQEHLVTFTVVMQVIAADLGGMITPFGNPQNLYAYSRYNLYPSEFFEIMIAPFLIAVVLLVIFLLFVPNEEIKISKGKKQKIDINKTIIYSLLFILLVLMIFRVIDLWICVVTIIPIMLMVDWRAFGKVDYTLLFTFMAFFVVSGNISRFDIIREFITKTFAGNELELTIGICQFLSNVPTTVLLSNFTENYKALLVAVNIGSLGTLVASMASLIAYRHFAHEFSQRTKQYIKIFTIINVIFLLVMYLFVKIIEVI